MRVLSSRFIRAALSALCLCVQTGAASADEFTEGIVQIFSLKFDSRGELISSSTGTGFVLNDEGYIATNNHVVEGATHFYVNPDGKSTPYSTIRTQSNVERIVWASGDRDLAIIHAPNVPDLKPVVLAEKLPEKGEPVQAVGYPGVADHTTARSSDAYSNATYTSGVLSRVFEGKLNRKNDVLVDIVQHSAVINGGNSGGPLIDECDRVLGVNTLGISRSFQDRRGNTVAETDVVGVYYASNISELRDALETQSISYRSSDGRCLSETDQLTRMIQYALYGAVALIACVVLIVLFGMKQQRAPATNVPSPPQPQSPSSGPQTGPAPRPIAQSPPQGQSQSGPVTLYGKAPDGQTYRLVIEVSALETGAVMIGREPSDRSLAIKDDSVSRQHAVLRMRGGRLKISDENSTNGTFVRGRRLEAGEEAGLSDGDAVTLGEVAFTVRLS
ncbi:MAG: trypsin-like peptidase domain-containing protein [Pseudomonadota bacterium]